MISVLLLAALAAAPADYFVRGNAAYEAGQYAQAQMLYDSALARASGANLYYNRGNAWFKQGQVGRAIADYSRAYVLKPLDRDIRNNLAFARAYRPDKLLIIENPIVKSLASVLRAVDLGLARIIAGISFLLAMAALAALFIRGDRLFTWLAVGFGVVFSYGLGASISWSGEVNPSRVVVVVPELTLRSGPGSDYKEIAVVHDGLEGVIRERRPGFVLIQIPGGQGGWVDTPAVEQVFGR